MNEQERIDKLELAVDEIKSAIADMKEQAARSTNPQHLIDTLGKEYPGMLRRIETDTHTIKSVLEVMYPGMLRRIETLEDRLESLTREVRGDAKPSKKVDAELKALSEGL